VSGREGSRRERDATAAGRVAAPREAGGIGPAPDGLSTEWAQ